MKIFSLTKTESKPEKQEPTQEKRDYNPGWMQSLVTEIMSAFSGPNTGKIAPVSETMALTVAAVYSAVKLMSELPASLDLKYETLREGEYYAEDTDHPINLLLNKPNGFQTGFTFIQSMLSKMHLRGNAYAFIAKRERGTELIPVYNHQVDVLVSPTGDEVFYRINGQTFADYEIIHFRNMTVDGVLGLSPIYYASRTINNAIDAETYMAKVFEKGIHASGFFTTAERLTDKVYERLKKDIEEQSGIERAGNAQILEQGLRFERNTISAVDSQIMETMGFTVEQICRIYRVPKHLLYLDAAGGSTRSFATQAQEFVTYSLGPLLNNIEEEIARKLLPTEEVKTGTGRIIFDTKVLLRADTQQRIEYYKGLFNIGAITTNEIRAEEGLEPIDGGDQAFVQLNLAPIDKIDEVITQKIEQQVNSTNG